MTTRGIRRKKSSLSEVKIAVVGAQGVGKSGMFLSPSLSWNFVRLINMPVKPMNVYQLYTVYAQQMRHFGKRCQKMFEPVFFFVCTPRVKCLNPVFELFASCMIAYVYANR